MGPQVLHVPVLLVLAYLAIGYVFWVLAQLGSWAQTRVRELDYLRLADAPRNRVGTFRWELSIWA